MPKKEILNNDVVTVRIGETAANLLQETADATEKTLDILEDTAERVITVTRNNPFLLAGALVLGVGIGGFVAYKLTKKRLSDEFEEELREQVAMARAFRRRVDKEGEFESPESAVKALVPDEVVEAVQAYQGREKMVPYNKPETIVDPRPPVDVVVEEVKVTQNVFVQAENEGLTNDPRDWDYNAEIADRELHPNIPYAISFEEFNENAEDHEQTTLTYYAMDDTLVDAQDKPIDNTDYAVGDDNLNRFGHGSGDPNVVYVRNEKIDMDFEIVRSNGSYQKEVFGTDPERDLSHSRRRPNRRSWRADE